MKTFETALEDIYARANDIQIAEKRRNKRIMKIATSCASICIIFVVALAVIRPFDDKTTEDGRVVLEGKNGNKKWITDIPGAVYIENPEYFTDGCSDNVIAMNREEFIEFLKSKSLIVLGDVGNINSFYIDYEHFENGHYSWFITTFDIKVAKEVKGNFETSTIKCVTRLEYIRTDDRPEGSQAIICGVTDIGKDIIENPSGVFVLEETVNDRWLIDGKYYDVSDYADYYVPLRYDYDLDGIHYFDGNNISLDEIKNN